MFDLFGIAAGQRVKARAQKVRKTLQLTDVDRLRYDWAQLTKDRQKLGF